MKTAFFFATLAVTPKAHAAARLRHTGAAPDGLLAPTPTFRDDNATAAATTATPSDSPSSLQSVSPSTAPSDSPSKSRSGFPSAAPSDAPLYCTKAASAPYWFNGAECEPCEIGQTFYPCDRPDLCTCSAKSSAPAPVPTDVPTTAPTDVPSDSPSALPSVSPSTAPIDSPSRSPSRFSSAAPSGSPSASPSRSPSGFSSAAPSDSPSTSPSSVPTPAPLYCTKATSAPDWFNGAKCEPCERGQTFYPCDRPDLCTCSAESSAPESAPNDVPASAPMPTCAKAANAPAWFKAAECDPCEEGQTWYPCNRANLCTCSTKIIAVE